MDPVTLLTLSVGASLVSGAVSSFGAYQQGQAQAAAAEYNAAVSDRNATLARQQAGTEADDLERQQRRQMGSIRAAYGAAGIGLAGSPLDVIEDTALEQATDVKRVGYTGELKAIGMEEKAALYRAEADNARTSGTINAISQGVGAIDKATTKFFTPGMPGASMLRRAA